MSTIRIKKGDTVFEVKNNPMIAILSMAKMFPDNFEEALLIMSDRFKLKDFGEAVFACKDGVEIPVEEAFVRHLNAYERRLRHRQPHNISTLKADLLWSGPREFTEVDNFGVSSKKPCLSYYDGNGFRRRYVGRVRHTGGGFRKGAI